MLKKNCNTIKAAKFLPKSEAKVIKWETRTYSQGIRDIPVEVSATTSQPRPRKMACRRPRAESNNMSQGEAAPQPMDINETFWVEEQVIPTSEKRVRQPTYTFLASLTYLPALAHLHWRLYPQDWALPMLPPWFRRRSSNGYMLELQVCSVWVEVLWLLSHACTLQGVLPRVAPVASFSQSSKMGRKPLHAIVVAGCWGVLAAWAFWGTMPRSNCMPWGFLFPKSRSKNAFIDGLQWQGRMWW